MSDNNTPSPSKLHVDTNNNNTTATTTNSTQPPQLPNTPTHKENISTTTTTATTSRKRPVSSTTTNTDNTDTYDSKRYKKPVNLYQIFASKHRQDAINAGYNDYTQQSKYLSELYKNITEDEKAELQSTYDKQLYDYEYYTKKHNEQSIAAEMALSMQLVHNNPLVTQIPLPRVKKLMGLDDDVQQITKEAVALVDKACEEFIMWLTRRTVEVALYNNKRTLRDVDFDTALTLRPELFFLRATLKGEPDGPTRQEQERLYQASLPAKQSLAGKKSSRGGKRVGAGMKRKTTAPANNGTTQPSTTNTSNNVT